MNIKKELFDRYVDDQDTALRSFVRLIKFCPLAGEMVPKTANEIESEKDLLEDQIVMEELRKVADTIIDMFKTEADSPGNHPELGYKVPILDLAVWVESVKLPATGLDDNNLHSSCVVAGTCLPLGSLSCRLEDDEAASQGVEEENKRQAQQIYFEFYIKPTKPKRTFLASSANPWQQKRTTLTQELMRRLRNTKKESSCQKKTGNFV